MSTRGGIVRLISMEDGKIQFKGRYHHWDSYPTGLGKSLFRLYNEHFNKNLHLMLKVLIDDHPAGWSTLVGADFKLPIGYKESEKWDKDWYKKPYPAQCYCHGGRHEEAWELDQDNASGGGVEWVYAFSPASGDHIMTVLASFCDPDDPKFAGKKMIGYFGMGDPKAIWTVIAEIPLNGMEPDWEKVEKMEEAA
jgi:hypothetical protein